MKTRFYRGETVIGGQKVLCWVEEWTNLHEFRIENRIVLTPLPKLIAIDFGRHIPSGMYGMVRIMHAVAGYPNPDQVKNTLGSK